MDGHRPVTLVPYIASADSHEPEAGKARHSLRMKLSTWFGSGAFPATDRGKLIAGFLDDGTGPGWERPGSKATGCISRSGEKTAISRRAMTDRWNEAELEQ